MLSLNSLQSPTLLAGGGASTSHACFHTFDCCSIGVLLLAGRGTFGAGYCCSSYWAVTSVLIVCRRARAYIGATCIWVAQLSLRQVYYTTGGSAGVDSVLQIAE